MLESEKKEKELSDEELNNVAAGGTYNKNGFLKTTAAYSCQHFSCNICGIGTPHIHEDIGFDNSGCTIKIRCRDCKWHKTLLCTNPLNKRS